MRIWIIGKKQLVIAGIVLAALIVAGIVFGVRGCAPSADEASAASVEAFRTKERPVYYVQKTDKVVALTFDACWDADKTPFILQTLKDNDIKATFFLVRLWSKRYPDMVTAIKNGGHELANHSATHAHMSQLDKAGIVKELIDMDDHLESIAGVRSKLFRPPYGEYNDLVVNTAREAGYEVIQWNIDTLDWKLNDANTIIDRVMSKLEPGSIILCHNNGNCMETYLPAIIKQIKAKGYSFVMVSDLLLKGDSFVNLQGMQCPKPTPLPTPMMPMGTPMPKEPAAPKGTAMPKATMVPSATPKT